VGGLENRVSRVVRRRGEINCSYIDLPALQKEWVGLGGLGQGIGV
jgi:hypothetical protein